jgi:hypothetical protein
MVACRYEEKNMANLGEAQKYFKEHPTNSDFKKFNFYSSRYNEGWDLEDNESATMILLTDTGILHSLVGIPYKGFQAVGRLRATPHNKPHKIYHITNNLGLEGMNTLERIQETRLYNAKSHIGQYNSHKDACKRDGQSDLELMRPIIESFAEFDNGKATLNHDKLDQISCAQYCREMYNNEQAIKKTWEQCNYNVEEISYSLPILKFAKKTSAEMNKEIITHILELQAHPEKYVYGAAQSLLKSYRAEYSVLIDAIEILGIKRIGQLEYNTKAMKAELIERSNGNAEGQLRIMLAKTFTLNEKYTNKDIKCKLQAFYDELSIRNSDGSRKIATASQLDKFGMFGLAECKVVNDEGKLKPGWQIWRINYVLSKAA